MGSEVLSVIQGLRVSENRVICHLRFEGLSELNSTCHSRFEVLREPSSLALGIEAATLTSPVEEGTLASFCHSSRFFL